MEFRNEAQRLAYKKAFMRITSDESWAVMRVLAEETIHALEQKALAEDDEAKSRTYRGDARGARSFWKQWLKLIELVKDDQPAQQDFLEVVMD